MPEYQAIMQLLVAKGQVIPRVAQVPSPAFANGKILQLALQILNGVCRHSVRACTPFPGARLGGLKAPYPSHFKSRPFAGKKERGDALIRRLPETSLNRYGF